MSKLTENMWNEVLSYHETKEDEIMENGVTLDEYMEVANAIINKNNPIINTGIKSLKIKSQNLAKALAEGKYISDSVYNSKTDAIFIDACVVEGEFYNESNLYELARHQLESEFELEQCDDIHNQVLAVKNDCIKTIEGAIVDVQCAREESQASKDTGRDL